MPTPLDSSRSELTCLFKGRYNYAHVVLMKVLATIWRKFLLSQAESYVPICLKTSCGGSFRFPVTPRPVLLIDEPAPRVPWSSDPVSFAAHPTFRLCTSE